MKRVLEIDKEEFSEILEKTFSEIVHFFNSLDEISTQPNVKLEHQKLSYEGWGSKKVLEYFQQAVKPIISGSSGPKYWGFVTGGATPAALIGDFLATIYDQNTQRINQGGDISALLEVETVKMLLDFFSLPDSFEGGFVTGATMSNFTCLATARQWAGHQINKNYALEGVSTDDFVILSAEPHSSVVKCLSMLGIGSNNIVSVRKKDETREAVDVEDLEQKLELYKAKQIIISTSGGTVNTVDFDDMKSIRRLKEKYNFWWHIDAAFGGFANILDEYKHLLDGWENADSIAVDCHKWMNVPYENAVYFIRKEHSGLQMQVFQNSNAAYLGNPEDNFSYGNFTPENSRRFRALPTWFTLKAYGKEGYQNIVRNNIQNAQKFSVFVENHPALQLLSETRLNCVCFSLKENPEKSSKLLDIINENEKIFMTPTKLNNKAGIRAAFVNWRTSDKDLDVAFTEIQFALDKMDI
ncbi:MAG: pyridoxal-dependent decarboxylase [Chryseobacterium sp.]|nr:pyridoxal-dependent decarboxylase [Chryseobacterium sp.]MDN5480213.1 pyridoxal-dependent decarboxylase [Chryseobacterium sp.]